ncbi:MAG: aminodeoxychorismate synthase component I [Gammaproteobacteria bacterium]|jgi:para-aminobenzoate synthetase component 1
MQQSLITELAYVSNSTAYFEQIKHESWPIFLDSCQPFSRVGRYDILSAAPYTYLTTYGQNTQIFSANDTIESDRDPFLLLKDELAKHTANTSHLPFNGGALGFFAYDLNKRLEILPNRAICDIHLPDMAVGIYLWAVIVDHLDKKTYLLMPPKDKAPANWAEIYERLLRHYEQIPRHCERSARNDGITSNLSLEQYCEKFAKIQQHIHQGDAYQINFAQRWQLPFDGNSWDLYCQLREQNPAPFAAYIPLQEGAILSCSPERFITVREKVVTTMPIKGTAKRQTDPLADQVAAQTLQTSEKNRAENIMIVDLMRNDLGKDCVTCSVQVPKLCELQSFPNVHHLVSTVCGELRADKQPIDVLRDCFPGGSITGAPKIRAMEIIDDCEPHRRHIYCGSIGYIGFNGEMDTNIAIRTAVLANQQLYFWGGGGIVKDSVAVQEYQETIDKVQPFFDILL